MCKLIIATVAAASMLTATAAHAGYWYGDWYYYPTCVYTWAGTYCG